MAEGVGQGRRPELSGGEILGRVAKWAGISPVELGSGSKRPAVVGARGIFSYAVVRRMGLTTVEAGKWIKVTQSAVSKLVWRGRGLYRIMRR
jgi:hypothetical protein